MNTQIHKEVSDKIRQAMKEGEIPWQHSPFCEGFPKSISNKCRYFGVNVLLLNIAAKNYSFMSEWWGTADEWRNAGFEVKAKATPVSIVSYNRSIKYQEVYNFQDVTGDVALPECKEKASYGEIDRLIEDLDVRIVETDKDVTQYHYPPMDYITFPPKERFPTLRGGLVGYYETMFHELAHWSEFEFDWDNTMPIAMREMRAEMASAFVCTELGLDHSIAYVNHIKNLDGWLKAMEKDSRFVFRVAAAACDAVDFILSYSKRDYAPRYEPVKESDV
jgi:antirestriction protein ArdC